ncbi:hypothetical protein BGZ52_012660, partial [Haplosporangium bisporale]
MFDDHLVQGQPLFFGCDPATEDEVWMDPIRAAVIGMTRPTQGRIMIQAVPQFQSLDEDNDEEDVYALRPEA